MVLAVKVSFRVACEEIKNTVILSWWSRWIWHEIVRGHVNPLGGSWVNICWVCAAGLSEPLPIIVYCVANYRLPSKSLLGKCNFRVPSLITFCLCIYLIKPG